MPIEFEVDKMLGIKGKQDVLDMGIKACVLLIFGCVFLPAFVPSADSLSAVRYNAKCRSIVMRCEAEWKEVRFYINI